MFFSKAESAFHEIFSAILLLIGVCLLGFGSLILGLGEINAKLKELIGMTPAGSSQRKENTADIGK